MLIFWERRLVFLATPKAGSTAIEAALEGLANVAVQRPPELKHTDLRRFRRHIAPWLHQITGDRFMTVALMREPIAWLQSWYRFRLRDDAAEPAAAPAPGSFAAFATDYADTSGQTFGAIGRQLAFLTDGEDRIDRIFRYEDMPAFTHFLEDRLDCAISLPRLNVPPAVDVSLDGAHEQALRDFMAPDLQLYQELAHP